MIRFLAVALGGALGAVARYSSGRIALIPSHPHVNTLLINVAGCFAIGLAWTFLQSRQADDTVRLMVIAGFLGGFTTYSSFSLESIQLIMNGRPIEAICYAISTVILCLGSCATAIYLAGKFAR